MRIPPESLWRLGLSVFLLMTLNACLLPDLQLQERLRPIRTFLNKDRNHWTDRIEYQGEAGLETVYYKNGRPALERWFDESGLLITIRYLGRNGQPLRTDSLVYAGEELIGGYFFSEPEHQLQLRFLNYQQQGQLSQRSWFGSEQELLSREFFLFDRHGQRRMRMIFDGNDSLLYTESFRAGTDELEIQNTYSVFGKLVSQTIFDPNKPPYKYEFEADGKVTRISQLHAGGEPAWSSDLYYNSNGTLSRSNFSIDGRFIFTHMGDLELFQQTVRSWRHPASPSQIQHITKFSHTDPFIRENVNDESGLKTIEYRLPRTGALFKRSILGNKQKVVRDSIYITRQGVHPISVRHFDAEGGISHEVLYDMDGQPRWFHKWFRDDAQRVIREEVSALPDTFAAAVSRFYDTFNQPAFSESFTSPDSFDGTWVFYHGGGVNRTLFYDNQFDLTRSWLLRPSGDTTGYSTFETIDYIRVESKYGLHDTLLSQHRFTADGILSWELLFDPDQRIVSEVHRKRDGSIFREVDYDHNTRNIIKSTYAPLGLQDDPIGAERGELTSRVVTKLSPEGHHIQIVSYNSSGEKEWEKRNAYREGVLLKSAQLDPQGKPIIISNYTHNAAGQVLSEEAVDKHGEVIHTIQNQYDKDNQLIWTTFSSPLTGMSTGNRLYYDEQGRLQRDEIIEDKRFVEAVEYIYFPEYYLRLASHYTPDGEVLRKEIENYFGTNVFALGRDHQE